MRTLGISTLLLAVAVMWVSAARAQEMPLPEGTTVKLILLRQKSVQKELKLTADEVNKITDFTLKQHEAAKKALGLTKDEAKEKFAALEKENKTFLMDNLKPEQRKRLDQITMQLTGLMHLARKETIKTLSLTEAQVGKVKERQKIARKELAKVIGTKEGRSEKLAKLREETRAFIMDLLTEEQRVIARQLAGEPFTGEIVFEEEDS